MDPSRKFEHFSIRLITHLVGEVTLLAACWLVHDYVLRVEPTPGYYYPKTAIALFIYLVLLASSRVYENGSFILLETLWCCNLALLHATAGMLTGRPLLATGAAVGVCMDQFCWYVDLVGYFATGKFPVGVTKYLFWARIKLARKLSSTHHLWFIPVVLWSTQGRLPPYSWVLSSVFTAVSTIYARLTCPKSIVDPLTGKEEYLNINCGYEFWKDVPKDTFFFLHSCNDSHPVVFVLFIIAVFNPLLNGPVFLLLKAVTSLL